MRKLLIAVVAVGICLWGQQLVAQTMEVDAPQVAIMFGTAEESEDGKLAFSFDAGAPMIPVQEEVTQAYVVRVPYTEETERDGERVTENKYREETRTRTVTVTRMIRQTSLSHAWDELSFVDPYGDKISLGDARGHFETKQPFVAMYDGQELDPYFQHVLRDDIVIVVLPLPEGVEAAADWLRRPAGVMRPVPVPMPRRR